jgi:hypothetical protein
LKIGNTTIRDIVFENFDGVLLDHPEVADTLLARLIDQPPNASLIDLNA